MKIGVLQCDTVLAELQQEFGDYPDMFRRLMRQASADMELIFYNAIAGALPADINECDGYMTTGSRHGVNDGSAWIQQLEHFVRALYAANKKLVGICFGHQLIAKALGGRVERSAKGWGVGVARKRVAKRKPWMQPFQETIQLVVSHQDQVTKLPQGAEVLAASEFCPFYMLAYQGHFLSLQGHPEFCKSYSRALTQKRRDRIPADRVEQALASLEQPVDDVVVARWINGFFHHKPLSQ